MCIVTQTMFTFRSYTADKASRYHKSLWNINSTVFNSVVLNVFPTCLCRTCIGFIIPMYLEDINALTLLAECHVIVEYRPEDILS